MFGIPFCNQIAVVGRNAETILANGLIELVMDTRRPPSILHSFITRDHSCDYCHFITPPPRQPNIGRGSCGLVDL